MPVSDVSRFVDYATTIAKTMRDFTSESLPHDSISSRHMLQEHHGSYKAVEEIFSYTYSNGKDALVAAGEEENFVNAQEEIHKLMEESQEKHEEWSMLWEAHKRKLQESVGVCQFEQDINQVS